MALGGPIGSDPFGGVPEGFAVNVSTSLEVRIAVYDLLGPVDVIASAPSSSVKVAVNDLLGLCEAVAKAVNTTRISTTNLLGRCRARAKSSGSLWVSGLPSEESGEEWAPLPCLQVDGYQINNDAGIKRTEMESGVVRQRVRWTAGVRRCTARVVLTPEQLVAAEELWTYVGAGWWELPLVSGASGDGTPSLHTVRLAEPVQVRVFNTRYYEAEMLLEFL